MIEGRMNTHFWEALIEGIGFRPLKEMHLSGKSGHIHSFNAIGVDDHKKRLLLLSSEIEPKITALVAQDIALQYPEYHVLTARPVPFDIQQFASTVSALFGSSEFDLDSFTATIQNVSSLMSDKLKDKSPNRSALEFVNMSEETLGLVGLAPAFMPTLRASAMSGIPIGQQIVSLVRQLSAVEMMKVLDSSDTDNTKVNLRPLIDHDSQFYDRELGICPIPLYEFSKTDWSLIEENSEKEEITQRLVEIGIRQYFYPPVDHVALGLIDRSVGRRNAISEKTSSLEELGHPLAAPEIVDANVKMSEMIDALKERDLVVEGEFGYEVTAEGKTVRSTVKYRPREGIFARIVDRTGINIDTSNWFSLNLGKGESRPKSGE